MKGLCIIFLRLGPLLVIFSFVGLVSAQQSVSFPDYIPLDPASYCQRTYVGGEYGLWTSEIVGQTVIPYASGNLTAVEVLGFSENPDDIWGFAPDGPYLRLVLLEDTTDPGSAFFLSTDCLLAAPPEATAWGSVVDGSIWPLESLPFHGVTPDLSLCSDPFSFTDQLVEIQNITVAEGYHASAIVMWGIDKGHPFTPLNFHGKEVELGLELPTSDETGGYSLTDFTILGYQAGVIAGGGISSDSGEMGGFWELISVECPTAEDQVEYLLSKVDILTDAGSVNSGQGNSLTVKLEKTLAGLDGGKSRVASNLLKAFINQVVSLYEDGVLSASEAQMLVDAALAALAKI